MDASNPRTRSQISLNPSGLSIGSNRPKSLGPVVLASVATAVALVAGQYGLLLHDVGVFWVLIRVLVCGGIGAFGWAAWTDQLKNARGKSVEWTVLGAASMAFLVQQATLLTALRWLSPVRIVILTHAYTFIPRTLSSSKKTQRWIGLLAVIALSLSADSRSKTTDLQHTLLSYGSLGLHALSTLALEHTQGTLVPALGGDLTSAATTLGAACLAGPLYGFRRALADVTHQPDVSLASLAVIPFLALAFTHLQPIATRSLHTVSIPSTVFRVSYTLSISLATVIPFLLSFKLPSLVDLGTAFLSYYAFSGRLHMDAPSRTPAARLVRTYMKTILRNPESRKIFYFLVLNLVYMGVQMLYGVWTNSLGLISDAIHMAFDCMAIGVGLIASVMATWDPNERFTYGYGRIETLSGFANGIFLILISIFIIFEAIERLIDPPEMETAQLLLVSSIGLGVNLFGLFAMGGHHHHGHSHSHGHSHGGGDDHGHAHGGIEEKGHGHSHAAPTIVTPDTHSHSHGHDESHHKHYDDHGHSHDHGGVHTPNGAQKTNGHSHDGGHGHSHTGEHGHSHSQDHGHSHDSDHGHSHSGDHEQEHHEHAKHVNGSDHEHSHSHSDDHGHGHSHHGEPTRSDDHDHGHGHSHDHSHDHSSESHSHSHGAEHAHTPPNARPAPNRRFSGPPIHIPPADADAYPDSAPPSALARTLLSVHGGNVASPITPNYSFVHDEHYERAHAAESGPNLHSHGHGHSHEGHSDNMRGVFLHVLADTMGSVGVIISTLLIKFYGWTGFDPIASLFIAILIVASVVPLVMDTGKILALDVSSRQGSIQDALAEVAAIPGVARYEAARFWPKDSSAYVGSIRIRLARAAGAVDVGGPHGVVGASYTGIDRVVGRVDAVLRERIRGLEEVTIEVEGE